MFKAAIACLWIALLHMCVLVNTSAHMSTDARERARGKARAGERSERASEGGMEGGREGEIS